jgi:hypothetical protein
MMPRSAQSLHGATNENPPPGSDVQIRHIAICNASWVKKEAPADQGLPVSTSALICSAPSVDLYLVQRHITVSLMEPPE